MDSDHRFVENRHQEDKRRDKVLLINANMSELNGFPRFTIEGKSLLDGYRIEKRES